MGTWEGFKDKTTEVGGRGLRLYLRNISDKLVGGGSTLEFKDIL